jgi:arginyl-tRNA synthetase
LGKDVVGEALKKGVAVKDKTGAILVPLEKHGLPDKIMLRADETGVYFTRDLGLATSNFKKYKLDSRIYVVAAQQSLYFKQLFKTLELLGYEWAKNLYHLSYEMVNLPGGKMSSRLGRFVGLDEFIDEIVGLASKEVKKRNPDLNEKIERKIAESVGLAALKFAILKIEPDRTILFKKEDVVQFQGDTGPYLQYAHTRCAGILRKAGRWEPYFKSEDLSEEEKVLIKTLMRFPEVVEQAARDLRPHYICNYAYELATVFDKFYEFNPVLKTEGKKKNFRLALVEATKTVLKNALELIGIEALEKM